MQKNMQNMDFEHIIVKFDKYVKNAKKLHIQHRSILKIEICSLAYFALIWENCQNMQNMGSPYVCS